MSDNPTAERVNAIVTVCFLGIVALFALALVIHILLYPPDDPPLLGVSPDVGTSTPTP